MRSKIRHEHEKEIRRLHLAGRTTREIADAMKKLGLVVSKTAIANFLARDREERARDMKKAVREHMAPKVVDGVDAFETGHASLLRTYSVLMEQVEAGELSDDDLETKRAAALRTWDRVCKSQALLARFAGLDAPDVDDEADRKAAAVRMLAKIHAMNEASKANGATNAPAPLAETQQPEAPPAVH